MLVFTHVFISGVSGQEKFYYENNIYLNYKKIGNGEQKIFFLHGFGASIKSWSPIIDQIDSSDLTIYLFDLKGFGLSSKPKDNKYSIRNQGEILKKFIKEKNLNNIILTGHSYGGGVALFLNSELINKEEKIIKKTILIDCAAFNENIPFFIKLYRTPVINRLISLFPKKPGTKYTLKKIFYDKSKVDNHLVNRYMFSLKQKGMRYSFIKVAQQLIPDNYIELANNIKIIDNPVLIIWGKDDNIISYKIGEKLNKLLTNSELKIIDNCGHIPHEEHPKIVLNLVQKFINN